ncbi:MAG: hypothetical protein ABW178_12180 [Pseudoxanthomonas sp.]
MKHVIFLLTWALGALAIGWQARLPDGYLVHVRGITTPQPYPLQHVLTLLLVTAALTLALWVVIRPHTFQAAWERALIALLLSAATAAYFSAGAMHMPAYYAAFLLWLALITLMLLLLLVGCVFAAVRASRQ